MAGRDSNGNVSFTSGVPVVGGTTISSSVFNALVEMIRAEIEDSLSRSGKGGLTQPLRLPDGTVSGPGLAFTQETGSGLYRDGAGGVSLARLGNVKLTLTSTGVEVTGLLSETGAGGVITSGATTADATTTEQVTYTTASALSFTVAASKTVLVEYNLYLNNLQAAEVYFEATGIAQSLGRVFWPADADQNLRQGTFAAGAAWNQPLTFSTGATANGTLTVTAAITAPGTPLSVAFKFRSDSGGSATLYKGSSVRVYRVD